MITSQLVLKTKLTLSETFKRSRHETFMHLSSHSMQQETIFACKHPNKFRKSNYNALFDFLKPLRKLQTAGNFEEHEKAVQEMSKKDLFCNVKLTATF